MEHIKELIKQTNEEFIKMMEENTLLSSEELEQLIVGEK